MADCVTQQDGGWLETKSDYRCPSRVAKFRSETKFAVSEYFVFYY